MAISPFRPGSLTRTSGTNFVSMRNDLADLQRQLTTNQRADTYGGLGFERRTSLDMRARLSAIEGYKGAIDHATLRVKMMTQNLERLNKLGQDTKSDMILAKFDSLSGGQTIPQKHAEARLKEVVDLLNADLAGRSLFAGRAVDKLPIASFDEIMNGDGTQAGLKTVIAERQRADLGADGLGRLTLGLAGNVVTLSESADAGVRANFGFRIVGQSSSNPGALLTTPGGAVATPDLAFGTQPIDGAVVQVTFNRPDGRQETLDFVARSGTPNPAASPKEFQIGVDANATAANLDALLDMSQVAGVRSLTPPQLTATFTGGTAPSTTLTVGTPTVGDTVQITLQMRDGTKQTVELKAGLSEGKNQFKIGATAAETAQSLRDTLQAAVKEVAASTLSASSAQLAAEDFFSGSLGTLREPRRVAGADPATATGFETTPSKPSVIVYRGDDGVGADRATAPVRVDVSQTVGTGARANEPAIRNVMAQLGVLAAVTFEPTPTDNLRYTELTERVFSKLSERPGNPKVSDIASELATAAGTMKAASDRHAASKSMIFDALDGVEGVNKEEAAMAIMTLQNQLQASYQTTSMLSSMSLVNYL